MSGDFYRVLFVEDDEAHYLMLRELLALSQDARFQLDWASKYDEALQVMQRQEHDAYLLDYKLDSGNGLDLLQAGIQTGCRAPIIIITGHGNGGLDLKAMKAGAADYLVKGQIGGVLLERSIRYAIERKRAEVALHASEEYARNLIQSSLDMIIAVDSDRMIREFNRAAEETFGYRAEEVLGKHIDMLYASGEEGEEVYQTILTTHRCVREVMNIRKNGELFPSFVAASVLHDAQGRVTGMMGISRDITQRKRDEESLRGAHEELERRVAERTAALQDEIIERRWLEREREKLICELQEALSKVRTLSGMLPVCSSCKKIRDDEGGWHQMESYIQEHSDTKFSHGICPECAKEWRAKLKDLDPG